MLQLVSEEWDWMLWSRMNTISSRKLSRTAATVLHTVLSRCLAVLPADCTFRIGNHVGQFFRLYNLKPLVSPVGVTGHNSKESPLIHKFLVRQPMKKETAADPDYQPDTDEDIDLESDSNQSSDADVSFPADLVKNEIASVKAPSKLCPTASKPSSGKSLVSRGKERAWQMIGFAPSAKPSACLGCSNCLRNEQCRDISVWNREHFLNGKSELFLARATAAKTSASTNGEESETSLPSVNSLSSPLDSPAAGSPGSTLNSNCSGKSEPRNSSLRNFSPKNSSPVSSPPESSREFPMEVLPLRSSTPASSPSVSAIFFNNGSSDPAQETMPSRNNLFEKITPICHKTKLHSPEENPAKGTPLAEINNNTKRRQPLDFSSAFATMKKAKQSAKVDLPCTCDDCRSFPQMFKFPLKLFTLLQVCDCSSCWSNAGQGNPLPLPPV